MPTLLIWGDQDGIIPLSAQLAILAAIPSARLVVYAGTGHAVHWEQSERSTADLIEFVTEIDR